MTLAGGLALFGLIGGTWESDTGEGTGVDGHIGLTCESESDGEPKPITYMCEKDSVQLGNVLLI